VLPHAINASVGSGIDPDDTIKATQRQLATDRRFIPVSRAKADRHRSYTTTQVERYQADIAKRIRRMAAELTTPVRSAIVERSLAWFANPRNVYAEELRYHISQLARAALRQTTSRINRPLLRWQAAQTLDSEGRTLARILTQRRGRAMVLGSRSNRQQYLALRAATRAWRKAGYEVIACSPYRNSTARLEEELGVPGMTYRKLHLKMHPGLWFRFRHHARQFIRAAQNRRTYRLQRLRIDSSKVLIVDLAYRLRLKDLHRLVRDVHRHGGRLVLVTPRIYNTPGGRNNLTALLLDELSRPAMILSPNTGKRFVADWFGQNRTQRQHNGLEL
jgi:hypothetical protein